MAGRIGVVLAGGVSRRMRRPKAEILVDGVAIAERAARLLADCCERVVVSVTAAGEPMAYGFPTVADAEPGHRGPLAGIDAAFRTGVAEDLLVLACDYPNVSRGLLEALAARATSAVDVVLPIDGSGRDHPLVALWRRSAHAAVARALEVNRLAVHEVLARVDVLRLGATAIAGIDLERELVNWNRPEDLPR